MPTSSVTTSFTARERSGAGRRLARRVVRVTVILNLWVLIGFGVGLAACSTLPNLFGYRTLTVLSGSMEPALEVGSVVIDERISAVEVRRGAIVSFPDPARVGRTLTHRVRSARVEGATSFLVTKGDANDAPERWRVPVDDEIGRVAYHVPKLGYVRAFISSRGARLVVLAIVFALGLYLIVDIWHPRPRPRAGGQGLSPPGSPADADPIGPDRTR